VFHIFYSSYLPWFNYRNNIWLRLSIVKLPTMYFYPYCSNFVSIRYKYSPLQFFLLRYLQLIFFCSIDRTRFTYL
jgi:hypothetical protein